jgi:hypothetical protein
MFVLAYITAGLSQEILNLLSFVLLLFIIFNSDSNFYRSLNNSAIEFAIYRCPSYFASHIFRLKTVGIKFPGSLIVVDYLNLFDYISTLMCGIYIFSSTSDHFDRSILTS